MFSIRSGEAYRTRNVIVEAIADYERKRCASQALMTSPRLADPPPSGRFSAVDPEFHSLGTSIPGIAGAFEGESLAHSLPARQRADVDAERIRLRRGAVGSCVGVKQNESSAAGAGVARVPRDSNVVPRVQVEIADEGKRLPLPIGRQGYLRVEGSVALAPCI
jgi:hypothetical protein